MQPMRVPIPCGGPWDCPPPPLQGVARAPRAWLHWHCTGSGPDCVALDNTKLYSRLPGSKPHGLPCGLLLSRHSWAWAVSHALALPRVLVAAAAAAFLVAMVARLSCALPCAPSRKTVYRACSGPDRPCLRREPRHAGRAAVTARAGPTRIPPPSPAPPPRTHETL